MIGRIDKPGDRPYAYLMRGAGRYWARYWRGHGLALSLLALLVQALVPAGYMVGTGAAGPALVICTGHGAYDAQNLQHPGKAPASQTGAACAFAGHGLLGAPSLAPAPTRLVVAYPVSSPRLLWDLTPGRGLAAPPPPSQGPPETI